MGYIYIIREREFINSNKQIYKIGKTSGDCPNKRLCNYPKGSELIYTCFTNNQDQTEKEIKIKFKENYIQRIDIGIEYFEGDFKLMIKLITDIILNNFNTIVENDIKNKENETEIKENEIITIEELYNHSKFEEIIIYDKDCKSGIIRYKGSNLWYPLHFNDQFILKQLIFSLSKIIILTERLVTHP